MIDKGWITAPLILACALFFLQAPTVMAEESAVHQMAQIVMQLNHYPNESDKKTLSDIVKNGSPVEAAIANALLHMQHKVRPEDKAKLNDIAKDNSHTSNVRDLAMIIQNLNHSASAADKEKLRGM